MFSIPRATSPAASESTLPCWLVSSRAISSVWASTRFRKAYISFVRAASDVRRQAAERVRRGGDRGIDLVRAGQAYGGGLLAGSRVEDRVGPAGPGRVGGSVDVVMDRLACLESPVSPA